MSFNFLFMHSKIHVVSNPCLYQVTSTCLPTKKVTSTCHFFRFEHVSESIYSSVHNCVVFIMSFPLCRYKKRQQGSTITNHRETTSDQLSLSRKQHRLTNENPCRVHVMSPCKEFRCVHQMKITTSFDPCAFSATPNHLIICGASFATGIQL